MSKQVAAIGVMLLLVPSLFSGASDLAPPQPLVIKLDTPPPQESEGGLIVADVDNDGAMDYLVTVPGHLAVYANNGQKLWIKKTDFVVGGQSESQGLPGHHGPGVGAGDVDGDGKCEVVFLTKDGVLHVVDGTTGQEEAKSEPPVPKGAERWELALVVSFRDKGDQDILLQATNKDGYRMGRYLAAYAFESLRDGGQPLWTTDAFVSCAHNGARLADLDGDGRDEVLGATILGPDGQKRSRAAEFRGHIDSVFVADVRPEKTGLEVVLLEEGSNEVQVMGIDGPIWRKNLRQQEPQNAAVGRFKPDSEEIFVWCRSRYNEHQKPFVFDSSGKVVFEYEMDRVAPSGWTTKGVEVIHTIDWTGQPHQLACAKERHESGDVALFEPLTGQFVLQLPEKADRLYVADVSGDWREEIVILNGSELHVYSNAEPNPRPDHKRLWTDRNYRRLKQAHNYYSP
ncbi:MAG: FG-GAP-like repeat-containing protein [Pirellulaceae bacterium]